MQVNSIDLIPIKLDSVLKSISKSSNNQKYLLILEQGIDVDENRFKINFPSIFPGNQFEKRFCRPN